jgi:hypothetical protein
VALLSSTFALHDVRDVESFTGRIVERSGLQLSHTDREELHVYLIETCWEISERWQPPANGKRFSGWALIILRRRVFDWQRSRYRTRWKFKDRTYERPQPKLVGLDDPGVDRLDTTLAGSRLDGDTTSFAVDMRTLEARGRRPGRGNDYLGDAAA